MKTVVTIAAFIGFSLIASAQTPAPAKGYYAIGANAEKLIPGENETTATPAVKLKGFYGIRLGYKRAGDYPVGNFMGAKMPRHFVQPVATKGYYAIGSNARKL